MRKILALAFLAAFPAPALAQAPATALTPINCSGTVVTANTAVTPIPANTVQHGFVIQNLDTAEPLWLSAFGPAVAATPGSFVLAANTATTFANASDARLISPPGFGTANAVSVVAATAGHKFSCLYW